MTVELIVAKMSEMSEEFAATGVFSRKLALDAQTALGQAHNFAKIKRISESLDRGQYRYNGSAVIKPKQVKMANKTTAPELTLVKTVEEQQLDKSGPKVNRQHFAAVPIADPDYVPFGAYKELEKIIKSALFFPVFITGHSGNGKSSQVIQICAKLNKPLMRLSITKQSDKDELIGCKTLVDGNIVVQEGPVLTAMRNGCVLLLEELDTADAGIIMALQGILEGKPYYFAQSGEYIYPAPGFNVIATANTKGKGSDDGRYMGTNVLNDAFLERFGETYVQEFPAPAIEKKMVLNWMRRYDYEDEGFAEDLVKWADAIRRTFADGATDELISSRRLEHIVKSYSIFKNKKRCIERCTARFDDLTANAFRELFDKIASEEIVVPIEPAPNVVL
jgi:hypothetical protein